MTPIPTLVLWAALLIGLVFGAVDLVSGFCLTNGLRHWLTKGDGRLVRSFAVALAVALAGTQALAAFGLVDLSQSIYLQPAFSAPLMLVGGVLFGYGMVAANACASRALVLLGSGNLRSLVVVVTVAVTAEMTLKGLGAPSRLAALHWSQTTLQHISLPSFLTAAGLHDAPAHLIAAAALSCGLLAFAFSSAPFRQAKGLIAAGIAIGLLIPAGWFATGTLGADPFNPAPVASLTFVAPLSDTLQYMMLSTGSTLSFGIAVVAGVLIGSFVTAIVTRRFAIEGFASPRHMLRSLGGAALMGVGGALDYGCSVGQGLTGLSTLAVPSVLAATGILCGAAAALKSPVRIAALAPA
ncbi:MAG TPA: YeeE/YedE family protein [Xanthobacteraceae bacterium]|nr:YeeE/YedE family protein [Xanthobacteraceae bacterium]